ncbi:MAG: ribonuclease III [Rhodothermia bacterium]|nr:ribonuclease III [Rhodothermia bacterium]
MPGHALSRLRHWLKRRSDAPKPAPQLADARSLEELIGERISNESLYRRALRHRSVLRSGDGSTRSNERLEFLGDAVLGAVVADYLYQHFSDADEGFLTRLRSKLVNRRSLARCATRIGLGKHLEISENMDRIDGRSNSSILSDAFEAIVGAVYLDKGIESARLFIHRTLLREADLQQLARQRDNYKSLLLEHCQARTWTQPVYDVFDEVGPDHDKRFTVGVRVNGKVVGKGTAGSKKEAEQIAANAALNLFKQQEGAL